MVERDLMFMHQALALAWLGQYTAHPNPRVGCILVQNDSTIVGQGYHRKTGSFHAEIEALLQAKEQAKGATCYVTLEPCAHVGRTGPCALALIEAGVKRVVVATIDPNPLVAGKGIEALKAAGIEVIVGVLQKEAQALNVGFFSRLERRRPYVSAKIAMSLDGKVGMANGESQWITSEKARLHGHLLRARSGAIITSWQTVKQDNCRLTVRAENALGLDDPQSFLQPLRVIVDTHLLVPTHAAIFAQPGKTVVATSELGIQKHPAWENTLPKEQQLPVERITFAQKQGHIDLSSLLDWLAEKEINDVLIESGPTLIGAFIAQGLVDELQIYVAAKLLGTKTLSMVNLPEILKLEDHVPGSFSEVERVGEDLHLVVKLSDFARKS